MSISQSNDAYTFFLCAVRVSESASLNRKKKLYSESLKDFKISAYCFARALLAASGKTQEANDLKDDELIAELSDISVDISRVLSPAFDLMKLDTNETVQENSEIFKDISEQYIDALARGRKILVHDLNYHEKFFDDFNLHIFPRAGFKKICFISILLIIFLLSPVVAYIYLEPAHNSNLVAQIFWRSNISTAFNVERSYSFPVREGKQFHEYTIPLPDSVRINSLRVDPMHKNRRNYAEIGIEWIRLFSKNKVLLKELTSRDLNKWSCTNCVELTDGEKNIYIMRVNNNRPYMVSELIGQDKVNFISIKLRIISKKTFWEWVLGIVK